MPLGRPAGVGKAAADLVIGHLKDALGIREPRARRPILQVVHHARRHLNPHQDRPTEG